MKKLVLALLLSVTVGAAHAAYEPRGFDAKANSVFSTNRGEDGQKFFLNRVQQQQPTRLAPVSILPASGFLNTVKEVISNVKTNAKSGLGSIGGLGLGGSKTGGGKGIGGGVGGGGGGICR